MLLVESHVSGSVYKEGFLHGGQKAGQIGRDQGQHTTKDPPPVNFSQLGSTFQAFQNLQNWHHQLGTNYLTWTCEDNYIFKP